MDKQHIEVYLGVESGALPQEGSSYEPETVRHGELVLHDVRLCEAGVRVVPLVGGEASHHEEGEADQ